MNEKCCINDYLCYRGIRENRSKEFVQQFSVIMEVVTFIDCVLNFIKDQNKLLCSKEI